MSATSTQAGPGSIHSRLKRRPAPHSTCDALHLPVHIAPRSTSPSPPLPATHPPAPRPEATPATLPRLYHRRKSPVPSQSAKWHTPTPRPRPRRPAHRARFTKPVPALPRQPPAPPPHASAPASPRAALQLQAPTRPPADPACISATLCVPHTSAFPAPPCATAATTAQPTCNISYRHRSTSTLSQLPPVTHPRTPPSKLPYHTIKPPQQNTKIPDRVKLRRSDEGIRSGRSPARPRGDPFVVRHV